MKRLMEQKIIIEVDLPFERTKENCKEFPCANCQPTHEWLPFKNEIMELKLPHPTSVTNVTKKQCKNLKLLSVLPA